MTGRVWTIRILPPDVYPLFRPYFDTVARIIAVLRARNAKG